MLKLMAPSRASPLPQGLSAPKKAAIISRLSGFRALLFPASSPGKKFQIAPTTTNLTSKPLPTGKRDPPDNQVGYQAASRFCCGVRPLERPSGGSAQWATRHGCRISRPRPWMADGGGPTEQDRSEGMPSQGEAPNEGAEALWLLSRFSKVTRCKSETTSSRYRRNGYVHKAACLKCAHYPPTARCNWLAIRVFFSR